MDGDCFQSFYKICRLLWHIVEHSKNKGFQIATYEAPDYLLNFAEESKQSSCTVLASNSATTGQCLAVLDESWKDLVVAPRQLDPRGVDYGFLRGSITRCEDDHVHCKKTPEDVAGLQLIDICERKPVLAPKNCRYIALSYVWGFRPEGNLASPPLVIEDAMEIALDLGYTYLWVDRYVSLTVMASAEHSINNTINSVSIKTARRSTV